MELDAATKLSRFCFLGSLEPVFIHQKGTLSVTLLEPQLQALCKELDDAAFVQILAEVFSDAVKLVRLDAPIFAYAVYISTPDLNMKWKTTVRKAAPSLLRTDEHLFIFCKYSNLIRKAHQQKGFSRTVHKAISEWYEAQPVEAIRLMWLNRRGAHGYTHKILIKQCHISDETLGEKDLVKPFFKTCTELLKESETVPTESNQIEIVKDLPLQNGVKETEQDTSKKPKNTTESDEKTAESIEISDSIIISMSKLRTTKNKAEALKIIRKFKLNYSQVPPHLLRYAPIMEALIPSMTYMQLLRCWRNMARNNHLEQPRIFKLCQQQLDNKRVLHKANIHPILLLMQMHEMGIEGDLSRFAPKKVEFMKMHYFKQLYKNSFGQNLGTGLRIHITLNLQFFYKKKLLRNHNKLSFYDAAVALAFGYFKKEGSVEVFHWVEDKNKLEQIPWTKEMDIDAAIACCNNIVNSKNNQRLMTPILTSLNKKQVYDLFLTIVPTAGRGNPKQNSEFLCMFLDKYRETKNPKTKFIIVNLLKFKKSMRYSLTRNENILEICGLDEHTPDLISNFALNRFG